MSEPGRIREFFDAVAPSRDRLLDGHDVIRYEQQRRQRLVLRLLGAIAGQRILDVGCGNGRDLRVYAGRGARAIGVDLSLGMLRDARHDLAALGYAAAVPLIQVDAIRLPLAACAFDKAVCSEVIEHVPDPARLARELHRVVKPGGTVVVTTPNIVSAYGAYRRVQQGLHAARRLAGRRRKVTVAGHPWDEWKTTAEVVTLLREAGFAVTETLHACYIPSHLTYRLPPPLQRGVVRLTARVEGALEGHLRAFGYTIGVAARKPS